MPVRKLNKGGVRMIHSAIDYLFDGLKARALGPHTVPGGKKLYVTWDRGYSIPGIFESAAREEGHRPDVDLLDSLLRVSASYLDATRERCKAQVVGAVDGWLRANDTSALTPDELHERLQEQVGDVFDSMTSSVKQIVDTEASHARNLSLLDGYVAINAARGIDDPTIFWVCVHDTKTCQSCKQLHLLEDGVTPRVWKLSECTHGTFKRGDPVPCLDGLHPYDRCTMATLLPGFGFKGDGAVTYIDVGHDEYAHQRG